VDGIEKKANQPRDIIFSPDSKRVAYIAQKEKWLGGSIYWMVVDGAAGKKYDQLGPPVFSPDSKRVAYATATYLGDKDKWKWFVVVDGVEGKPYDRMFNPGYNYWIRWMIRVIFDSPHSLHYLALTGNSVYLVEESIR